MLYVMKYYNFNSFESTQYCGIKKVYVLSQYQPQYNLAIHVAASDCELVFVTQD